MKTFESVFLMIIVCTVAVERATSDVAASTAELLELSSAENILLHELDDFINAGRVKSEVDLLLERHHNNIVGQRSKYNMRPDHPISAYHLVTRFSTVWVALLWSLPESAKHLQDKIKLHLTTTADYDDIKRSLIQLQKTYNLSIGDMLSGNILGRKSQPLSQFESVRIAFRAVSDGDPETGIQWLTHAQHHLEPPLVAPSEIFHALSVAHAENGDSVETVEFTMKALELDPFNVNYLKTLSHAQEKKTKEWVDEEYFRICRESLENSLTKPNLHCKMTRNNVVPYTHLKVEYLHMNPEILMFHEILTDRESEVLTSRAVTLGLLQRAKVGSESGEGVVASSRTGKTGWFHDDDDSLIFKLSRRVGQATGLNVTYPTGERLQMSNYGIGGQYVPHFDRFESCLKTEGWHPNYAEDRIATFMFYLNDVDLGGSTVFPRLNLAIRPVKNSAVFWFNYNSSGYPDQSMLHAGCPVLVGVKWVANKWIRSFGNEINRPCPKSYF